MNVCVLIKFFGQEDIAASKRTAAKIAKEVSKFWLKINKVVAFKQKGDADDARQKVHSSQYICQFVLHIH